MRLKRICAIFLSVSILIGTGGIPAYAAPVTTAYDAANALFDYGLFRGSDIGFELERRPTRVEALVMLLRILGKEESALAGDYWGHHPFNDVPAWADAYVSFGYYMGYTNGISATQFGSGDLASAAMYVTLVLRALGYDDINLGDFNWASPWKLSDKIGITSGEYNSDSYFTRGDMCLVSYRALNTRYKNESYTLFSLMQWVDVISDDKSYPGGTRDWWSSIYLDEYDIVLDSGATNYPIFVKHDCDWADVWLSFENQDTGVLSCVWGENWTDAYGDTVTTLYVSALKPGKAAVYITFTPGYSDNPYELSVLNVIVE